MKRNRPLVLFVVALSGSLLLCACLWVAIVNCAGRGYCEQAFIPPFLAAKRYITDTTKSPRLFVFSGSNSQYSIDSEELSRMLGLNVVNWGTYVGHPIRFYLVELERALRPGDVLFMPLETQHYNRKANWYYETYCQSLYWGVYPAAQKCLTAGELFRLYVGNGLCWLQTSVPEYFTPQSIENRNFQPADAFKKYVLGKKWNVNYGLTEHGDIRCGYDAVLDESEHLPLPSSFTEDAKYSIGRIVDLAHSRGVRVLLGYPTLYKYEELTGLPAFMEELGKLRLPVCGRPEALGYPYRMYWNGYYHLNNLGRRFYTFEMGREIARALGKEVKRPADWPLIVFAETPDAVKAAKTEIYESGCRVCSSMCRINASIPSKFTGHDVLGEFYVDRGGASDKVVRSAAVDGRPVPFEETVGSYKNVLRLRWHGSGGMAEIALEFTSGDGVGLERLLMQPIKASRGDPTLDDCVYLDSPSQTTLEAESGNRSVFPASNAVQGLHDRREKVAWGGKRISIRLSLPGECRGHDLFVQLDAGAIVHGLELPKNRLTVRIAEDAVYETQATMKVRKCEFTIPAAYTCGSDVLLEIEADEAFAPIDKGINGDKRVLGVRFESLSWEPQKTI